MGGSRRPEEPSRTKGHTMKGAKWLNNASYLTDADRAKVMAVVDECKAAYPGERVGVRPPAYIGEPHPIATVIYGPGELIFRSVYREAYKPQSIRELVDGVQG